MSKRDATDFISLAECMRGTASPLGVSILCTEMTHTETGTLFDIMGPSFTPSAAFDSGAMTAPNEVIGDGDLLFMGPLIRREVVVPDLGIEATISIGI